MTIYEEKFGISFVEDRKKNDYEIIREREKEVIEEIERRIDNFIVEVEKGGEVIYEDKEIIIIKKEKEVIKIDKIVQKINEEFIAAKLGIMTDWENFCDGKCKKCDGFRYGFCNINCPELY